MKYREEFPRPIVQKDDALRAFVDERKIPERDRDPDHFPYVPRSHYASRITDCPRKLWYEWHQTPKDAEGERRPHFGTHRGAVGNAVEALVLEWLRPILVDRQVPIQHARLNLSGKIDGIIDWQGVRWPVEIKSSEGIPWEPKSDAYLQLQTYLLMTGYPAGYLIYADLKSMEKWELSRSSADPAAFAWVEQRANELEFFMAQDSPPDRPGGITDPSQYWRCGYCPLVKTCFGGS